MGQILHGPSNCLCRLNHRQRAFSLGWILDRGEAKSINGDRFVPGRSSPSLQRPRHFRLSFFILRDPWAPSPVPDLWLALMRNAPVKRNHEKNCTSIPAFGISRFPFPSLFSGCRDALTCWSIGQGCRAVGRQHMVCQHGKSWRTCFPDGAMPWVVSHPTTDHSQAHGWALFNSLVPPRPHHFLSSDLSGIHRQR